MAQATHTPAVTRTEIVEVEPATITLHLSMEETKALVAVCNRIGGPAATTRRKHFESIQQALWNAARIVDHGTDIEERNRAIYFTASV